MIPSPRTKRVPERQVLIVDRPVPVVDNYAACTLAAVRAGYEVIVPEGKIRLEPTAPPARRREASRRR